MKILNIVQMIESLQMGCAGREEQAAAAKALAEAAPIMSALLKGEVGLLDMSKVMKQTKQTVIEAEKLGLIEMDGNVDMDLKRLSPYKDKPEGQPTEEQELAMLRSLIDGTMEEEQRKGVVMVILALKTLGVPAEAAATKAYQHKQAMSTIDDLAKIFGIDLEEQPKAAQAAGWVH